MVIIMVGIIVAATTMDGGEADIADGDNLRIGAARHRQTSL
jgi:hypothetical protein